MNKLSIIGIFIFLTTVVTYSQSFKEEFVKAATFMENENFYSALPILFELEKTNQKNANIKSMIGYCYLNTSYEKYKAIPYFK